MDFEYFITFGGLILFVWLITKICEHGRTPGILQDCMPPEPKSRKPEKTEAEICGEELQKEFDEKAMQTWIDYMRH